MESVLVLMWRDIAATVEVRLTGGLAAMAAPVCSGQWLQEDNIDGGSRVSTLLLWSMLALKFLGGGRMGFLPGSHLGGG
jgi:hypothetical protein